MRVSGTEPFTYLLHKRRLVLTPSAFAPDPVATVIDAVVFTLMTDWYQASGDLPIDRSPLADLLGAAPAVVIEALRPQRDHHRPGPPTPDLRRTRQ